MIPNLQNSLLESKVPRIGTTIFAQIAQMVAQYNPVNLAQGFPDFDVSEELIELTNKYMHKGFNQYSLMPGVLPLREKISEMAHYLYGYAPNPANEITVTCGATEACYVAITSVIRPGDEVIIFEPAFDSYAAAVEINGGIPVYIQMKYPHFSIDWTEVREKITDKTRLIIFNTPHNPTGTILTIHDIHELISILEGNNILLLSDEVYEHMVFDGLKHESVLKYEELRKKAFVISSLGKTFHCTGWRVGYCIAPEQLTNEFRKVHQYSAYSTITPVQYAMAEYMENKLHYLNLPKFFEQKRDYFLQRLKLSRFEFFPARGSYFQLASYEAISNESDWEFVNTLLKTHGVAAIPLSYFYHNQVDQHIIRFCFAKKEETLEKAANILCKI